MHLSIISVGKLKSGPEKAILDDYVGRFQKAGPALGFRSLSLIDVPSGGGLEAEGARILQKIQPGTMVLRLDEGGKSYASTEFADYLATLRDRGTSELCFLIGGAEGYSDDVRKTHPTQLALGPQTWPHRLVKIMLSEQLYRAASVLAGLPYHKA